MDKKSRLYEIIQEVQDMYPELSVLIADDMEDPTSIIICTEDYGTALVEASGLEMEYVGMDDDLGSFDPDFDPDKDKIQ